MEPRDNEKVMFMTRLDQMERTIIDKVEKFVSSGWVSDAEKWSRVLVNLATYRRLKAGMKGNHPPGGE